MTAQIELYIDKDPNGFTVHDGLDGMRMCLYPTQREAANFAIDCAKALTRDSERAADIYARNDSGKFTVARRYQNGAEAGASPDTNAL